jgi:hypothetical protein
MSDALITSATQDEVETKKDKAPNLDHLACGYIVGLQPNGDIVWHVLGEQPGLVQLLGLHKYADYRLNIAVDINQGYGMPLVVKQLASLGQTVETILSMLTQGAKQSLSSLIMKK